jgi:hypothetical protein
MYIALRYTFVKGRVWEAAMNDSWGHSSQDKAIRVTWYLVGVPAIFISVWLSIHEILR